VRPPLYGIVGRAFASPILSWIFVSDLGVDRERRMRVAEKGLLVTDDFTERASDARRRSDALFNLLREDAFYERPIPERHRIIFYVGHLEAFDWNLLK